ncbi:asparagine synthase (glutamine-hydrolyzing) [Natranaerobius thermophilus]|uniref:asparagine synthase (glutamine-hydrolyzing) n=1 Tax=Natranaerobius thermophilus TaxID=375929 RepID=UPI0001668832|nr:asparagine synthase (glutamine-hydrolyzing) [Natranaerobius thermophilus]
MCGIVAVYDKESGDHRQLTEMLNKLNHRGPDEEELCNYKTMYLGHKRLSIIGPSKGRQPISNENDDIHLVVNGEVYNYEELKTQLSNHNFSTLSDSEVIIHLYEEQGIDCVKNLDGMFAFVLSDNEKPFVARDTLGIKPLYYAEEDGCLFFASEMKSLANFVKEVKEFPPGHYFTPETGFQQFRKIQVSYASTQQNKSISLNQITEGIRTRLEAAVKKRMMAHVPLGVFLSGGLDSSLVAALAKEHTKKKPLKSFCVGMKGGSDLPAARQVAEYLGTDHHELIYNEQDIFESLPRVIYFLESFDPSLIRSAIPTYFVCRLASKYVTVIL